MAFQKRTAKKRFFQRRKVCRFCADSSLEIDYKDAKALRPFITERGKIIPARISGATATQQREITTAVKRARYMALLPLSVSHRTERGFAGEMQLAASSMSVGMRDRRPPRDRDRDHMGDRDRDR